MTHLEAERRYQFATQKLVNLKWHLSELAKHSNDSYVRTQLSLLAGDTRKDIDNLLADDFVYDPSEFDTTIPRKSSAS